MLSLSLRQRDFWKLQEGSFLITIINSYLKHQLQSQCGLSIADTERLWGLERDRTPASDTLSPTLF